MLSERRDTIVALSTPPGTGGIAVVRLSGPRAFAIARAHLGSDESTRNAPLPHRLARRHWIHLTDGSRLDQALVLAFHAPHSYTGEDVVELHLHGSPWLVEQLLDDLCRDAVMAEPGEFTRRAVENGRLDLTQAEGVRALLEARGDLAHTLALRSLSGETGQQVRSVLQSLLDLLSLVEAELDFAEHEIHATPADLLVQRAESVASVLASWRESWRIGCLCAGATVVLTGEPNAGKSTLMNALLGESRVLVDEEPGTTRDAVSQDMVLGDLTLTLWDTAGLRDDADRVELMGVSRARDLLDRADLILHLRAPGQLDRPELASRSNRLVIHTMADTRPTDLAQLPTGEIRVSARNGTGLDELKAQIRHRLLDDEWQQLGLVLTEARHVQLVDIARTSLRSFVEAILQGVDRPLAALDLRDATEAVGAIVGGADFAEIYPLVFSRFCVGK